MIEKPELVDRCMAAEEILAVINTTLWHSISVTRAFVRGYEGHTATKRRHHTSKTSLYYVTILSSILRERNGRIA